MGRASKRCLPAKFPRFRIGQQPKLREMVLLNVCFWSFWFTERRDNSRNKGVRTSAGISFALSGLGNCAGGSTQGTARRLALPWATLFLGSQLFGQARREFPPPRPRRRRISRLICTCRQESAACRRSGSAAEHRWPLTSQPKGACCAVPRRWFINSPCEKVLQRLSLTERPLAKLGGRLDDLLARAGQGIPHLASGPYSADVTR